MKDSMKRSVTIDCIMKITEQLNMLKHIHDSDIVDINCDLILLDVTRVTEARPEPIINEADFDFEDTENPVDLEEPIKEKSIAEVIVDAGKALDEANKVDY